MCLFHGGIGNVIIRNRQPQAILLVLALALGALTLSAQPATATLQLLKPSPTDPATFAGTGGYSADGLGQDGPGGTVQADVPAGSTVVQAYLYGTYYFTEGGPAEEDRTLDFDGTIVVLQTLPNSEPGFCCDLYTARADVTTQVAAKVGAGGGITDFAVNTDPTLLDGVALVVIFSNATLPDVTIAVLDGGSKQTGDDVTFNFASPIDPTEPGFSAILSLGSGFSAQVGAVNPHDCGAVQFSIVEVNDEPLTSCAGNWDDGYLSNGGLITVGGVGDLTDNPADPTTQTGTDDELYNLVPFMSTGDTQLVIETANPSGDDNLFLAIIQVTAEATVTTEICDNGIDDDGDGLIDAADPDCAGPPPTDTTASGTKYYDANANGQLDAGEAGLADWPIDYDDGTTSASVLTDGAGNFSVALDPGDYTFAERQAASPWFQTGNTVDQSGGTADVTLNADKTYTASFDTGETATGLNFGNLCVGGGGGLTIGFWGNKNGQALIGPDDLTMLSALNLVSENGSAFDPTTAAQVKAWLRDTRAVNMAYMLSAQLAAMALNVHNGLVQGSALVYAPGTTSANAAGFTTVSALMAEANAELGLHPTAVSGDAWRAYQEALKNALDNANNNLTFVQANASTCPAPFAEASYDLYADGSVSCVGADDTTRAAGSVTFVESAGQVLFSVSLDGAAPNASYTLAISEEPTCANAVFFADAIATDANGDGSFSGSFAKAAGTYNLLVNLVTSPVPSDPTNREIATVDTAVVVH
jgi:hypothetical protein